MIKISIFLATSKAINRFALLLIYFVCLNFFPAALAVAAPSTEKLGQEMGARITRVPEFEFIREEAAKLGVRVYLFGGTAAAYAHYVRQDLAREAGDKRYPDFLYDYDYTNIYRSSQDLDVVVDGSAEKAQALERLLQEKFPHFVGDKDAKWEVRPLREARGDKEAILNNSDFSNQHTDSHSTGLVEVTPTPKDELAVKDVRDWGSKNPQFLRDVAEQKLHYYFSDLHGTTNRARQEMNPPILSAIRYLTKAFQYDLAISGEDRARIQEIVQNFRPGDLRNDYVKKWVEKNGKKLIQNAVDIEYAWNTLEQLGLRKKLIAMEDNASAKDSLAWWMSKEPLRAFPVGEGTGRTATEILGKDLIISHEASSYLAYESITRSKSGAVNALISREEFSGESAVHGNGFYTNVGRSGAANTGYTIRMELDPKAREGSDFTFAQAEGYIVLKNKSAVKVLREELHLSLPEYFRQLAAEKEFSKDDRALIEHFKRRAGRKGLLSEAEKAELVSLAKTEFAKKEPAKEFVREWFSLPMSLDYPEFVEALIQNEKSARFVAQYVLPLPLWANHPEYVEALLAKGSLDADLVNFVLGQPHWAKHPEFVAALIKKGTVDVALARLILSQPHWVNHPEFVKALLEKGGDMDFKVAESILSKPHWAGHPEFVEHLVKKGTVDTLLALSVLSKAYWADHPEFVQMLIDRGSVDFFIPGNVLSEPAWAKYPELLEALLRKDITDTRIIASIKENVLRNPAWQKSLSPALGGKPATIENLRALFAKGFSFNKSASHLASPAIDGEKVSPEESKLSGEDKAVTEDFRQPAASLAKAEDDSGLLKTAQQEFAKEKPAEEFFKKWFSLPVSLKHPEFVVALIKNGRMDSSIAADVLSQPQWASHPELVEALLKSGKADWQTAKSVLSQAHWANHPEWVEALLEKGIWPGVIIDYVLSQPFWSAHPELLEPLLKNPAMDKEISKYVLAKPEWQQALRAELGGEPATPESLRALFSTGFTYKKPVTRWKGCGPGFAALVH